MSDLANNQKQIVDWRKLLCNPLYHQFRYTKGVKDLVEDIQLPWLMDYIFVSQNIPAVEDKPFQRWMISKVEDYRIEIRAEDYIKRTIMRMELNFTDFPFDMVTLHFENNTLMLPNEVI